MIAALESVCSEHPVATVRRAFVYFLIVGGRVVYVGQTNNVEMRLQQHWTAGNTFDRVLVREVPVDQADRYEGALMRALLPVLNRRCPLYKGGDNAVRAEFGLPLVEDEAAAASSAMATLRGRSGPRATSHRMGVRITPEQDRRNAKLMTRRRLYQSAVALVAADLRAQGGGR